MSSTVFKKIQGKYKMHLVRIEHKFVVAKTTLDDTTEPRD
jgi:hypothetical protein